MQNWYNPTTGKMEQVVTPANDAAAVGLFSGRKGADKVYNYLRGPEYRMSGQQAFQFTWEHFREVDAGRISPISAEVEDLG
jgi:hypothetical protein